MNQSLSPHFTHLLLLLHPHPPPHTRKQRNLKSVERHVKAAASTVDDPLGGVRFARIGGASNSYATDIIQCSSECEPFVVRSGEENLEEDFEEVLLDGFGGDTSIKQYLQACRDIKKDAQKYFDRKLIDENTTSLLDSIGGVAGKGAFHECAVRYSGDLFKSLIPTTASPLVRAHIAGIGFKAENIPPASCSMAPHVIEASSRDGAWR